MKSYSKFKENVKHFITRTDFDKIYFDILKDYSYDKDQIITILRYVYYYLEMYQFLKPDYSSFIVNTIGRLSDDDYHITLVDILYVVSHSHEMIDKCDNNEGTELNHYI